jgi:hypothetical protein
VSHDCACGRPIQDTAVVCPHCGFQLDAALAEITEYRGLAYDLDVTLSKQANITSTNGAPQAEEPQAKAPGTLRPSQLPYHGGASRAAGELKGVLVTWARVVIAETGVGTVPTFGPTCRSCQHRSCRDIRTRGLPTSDTIAGIGAWLRPHVGWLRYHEAGQEAVDEICDAVAAVRRVIDRPAERLYAGPCDCGVDLYARLEASYVTCRADAHEDGPLVWPVEERRRWLLRSAEDVLATTAEISRALTRYQQPVTPEMIRGYKARGRLVQRGSRPENGKQVALWRLGDVLAIVAPEQEKVSA